jgi:hypothetical protein
MSLLAKVFVVIQTILVLAYMGVSATLYQHKRDWRSSYAKLRERYSVATQRASKEIEALRQTVKSKAEFVQVKEGEVRQLKDQLAIQLTITRDAGAKFLLEQKRYDDLNRNFESTNANLNQAQKDLTSSRGRNDELTTNLEQANKRREVAEGQVARLIQLNAEVQKNLGDLRQSYADTRKALRDKELLIAMAEEQGVNFQRLLPGPPVPPIDGKVAAVKDDMNPPLVLLSVGSDDKVEKGFHFSIYRNSEFVGKVVVEKVLKDSCGCRVLFTKEGGKIQAGDSAATRLQ